MPSGGRNGGLDLVRAVAVTAVVAFHGTWFGILGGTADAPGWLSPVGGVAVETFYVLSGFLIGRILLRVSDDPTPAAWLRFMGRRWARTLPLYYCVLALAAFATGPSGAELARYATMTQNLLSPPAPSLFEGIMGTSWSLAVEEVFYLAFSAALLGACAMAGGRARWPVILAFLALPAMGRMAASDLGMATPYYVAVLNLDGIAWGVALAALEARESPLFRHPLASAVAGATLVTAAWWPYATGALDTVTSWQPGSLTLASAGCCLVVAASLGTKLPGVVSAAVTAVASRSYGIYLIHLPVLNAVSKSHAEGRMGGAAAVATFLCVTGILSWAAHRWIEIPGLAIPILVSGRWRVTPGAAGLPKHERDEGAGRSGRPPGRDGFPSADGVAVDAEQTSQRLP